jgi:pimeloyl-ACP methyl ester carboxylesterase
LPWRWRRNARALSPVRSSTTRLIPTYDPALAHNLTAIDPDRPIPTMWRQFEALARVPVLVIHGANSDILSSETVEAMKTRHPDMDVLVVADQGHAPLLAEPDIIARIKQFAEKHDAVHAAAAA